MSKSLQVLYSEHDDIINQIIENEGELTPEIESKLLELSNKIDACEAFMSKLDYSIDRIDQKIKEYQAAKKAIENRQEWFKNYIKNIMLTNNVDKLKGNDCVIKLQRTSPSVVIHNEDLVDKAYWRTKTVNEIDKKKIKEDLSLGVPVLGAILREGYTLKVKTRKD